MILCLKKKNARKREKNDLLTHILSKLIRQLVRTKNIKLACVWAYPLNAGAQDVLIRLIDWEIILVSHILRPLCAHINIYTKQNK